MKSTKWFIAALFLGGILITSCSNTENEEDLKLYQNKEIFTDGDNKGDPPPPPPISGGN